MTFHDSRMSLRFLLYTRHFYYYSKITVNNASLQVEAPRQIKKPSLFIRNVRKIGSSKLLAVMNQMNCERVRINDKSKDIQSDLAVAFFPTEESAFQALHTLKTLRVEGVKIAVSFRSFLSFSFFSVPSPVFSILFSMTFSLFSLLCAFAYPSLTLFFSV